MIAIGARRRERVRRLVSLALLVLVLDRPWAIAAAQGSSGGTIRGRVRITGKIPGNTVIRMGADPMCARINEGKRVVYEAVASTIEGHLANVFVVVEGTFPQAPPPPASPVVIDQRACIYIPRMVGVRVGQPVEVRNSDELLHNIHSYSSAGNEVNISQPKAGMKNQFRFKEERMLRLRCDIHGWMTSWVGIVAHPYFAVTAADGTFEIRDVPAGARSVEIWHEQLGTVKRNVQVKAGAVATVDFEYTGSEKPPGARGRLR
jgi:plastocyanin